MPYSSILVQCYSRAGKEVFPLPEPLIFGASAWVMSLRDGTKKMSKSDESDYSRLHLTDDADTIALKIRKAKSDMVPGIAYDPEKRPEAANLLTIYAALRGIPLKEAEAECSGDSFSAFKQKLIDVTVATLVPIGDRMRSLLADPDGLDRVLTHGAERAGALATAHMREVKETVGFWQKRIFTEIP